MASLCELATKYGTDKKPENHNYTPVYSYLMAGKTVKRVLEIGIAAGESLRMWEEAFPEAEIWGIDHEESKMIDAGRIHTKLCDQGDVIALCALVKSLEGKQFDLIVDDGSHELKHQALSATVLMSLLAVDGFYVIEDVSPGEWKTLQGALLWPSKMIDLNRGGDQGSRLVVIGP